jgi:hypothetical protein
MDLGEIRWVGMGWIGLTEYMDKWRALVNAVMNLRVSYNAGRFSSGCPTGGLSSSARPKRVKLVMVSERLIEKLF